MALRSCEDLLQAFELVTSKGSQAKFGYQIVRYKNKFHPDSTDTFKNIMVNALVRRVVLGTFRDKVPDCVSVSSSLPKMEISSSAR